VSLPQNGLSAYEVAVRNGFDGTEQEWLASMHLVRVEVGGDGCLWAEYE